MLEYNLLPRPPASSELAFLTNLFHDAVYVRTYLRFRVTCDIEIPSRSVDESQPAVRTLATNSVKLTVDEEITAAF